MFTTIRTVATNLQPVRQVDGIVPDHVRQNLICDHQISVFLWFNACPVDSLNSRGLCAISGGECGLLAEMVRNFLFEVFRDFACFLPLCHRKKTAMGGSPVHFGHHEHVTRSDCVLYAHLIQQNMLGTKRPRVCTFSWNISWVELCGM